MIQRVENELKIMGINSFIVSAAFTAALIVLSVIAGELLDFYTVSFEVILPFFAAMVVGEWGKTRADSNFDIVSAQSRSLFCWVLVRYLTAFGMSSLFAVFCMVVSSVLRYEFPLWELLVIYFPPAFLLSSLCALLGICCSQEHVATLVCGIVWLIVLLIHPGWLWNKGIITVIALFLWSIIGLNLT